MLRFCFMLIFQGYICFKDYFLLVYQFTNHLNLRWNWVIVIHNMLIGIHVTWNIFRVTLKFKLNSEIFNSSTLACYLSHLRALRVLRDCNQQWEPIFSVFLMSSLLYASYWSKDVVTGLQHPLFLSTTPC